MLNQNRSGGLLEKDKIPEPKVQPTSPVTEEKNRVTKITPTRQYVPKGSTKFKENDKEVTIEVPH